MSKKPLTEIEQVFAETRTAGRTALMPYYTLGYPTPDTSLAIIESAARSGADLLELGLPFSDPLADGPSIQRSTQVALEQGMTLTRCLEMTQALRQRGVRQPLILMGYYNPLLSYGLERFCQAAAEAGANGLIIPDLPLEEAGELLAASRAAGLALVFMLAPTSTAERIAAAAAQASGFLYLVSLIGVTGARQGLPPGLADFVERVRQATHKPVAVGFGIATPEQAQAVGRLADGVIVGSALINAVDRRLDNPAQAAAEFIGSLRRALEPAPAALKSTVEAVSKANGLPVGDEPYPGFLGC